MEEIQIPSWWASFPVIIPFLSQCFIGIPQLCGLSRFSPMIYIYLQSFIVTNSSQLVQDFTTIHRIVDSSERYIPWNPHEIPTEPPILLGEISIFPIVFLWVSDDFPMGFSHHSLEKAAVPKRPAEKGSDDSDDHPERLPPVESWKTCSKPSVAWKAVGVGWGISWEVNENFMGFTIWIYHLVMTNIAMENGNF